MGFFNYGYWTNEDWVRVLPIAAASAAVAALITHQYYKPKPWCNVDKMKENPKVTTSIDLEDIGDKKAFCRCWRSKQFPLCDGSHNDHNAKTGDNVGPLVIKKRAA